MSKNESKLMSKNESKSSIEAEDHALQCFRDKKRSTLADMASWGVGFSLLWQCL